MEPETSADTPLSYLKIEHRASEEPGERKSRKEKSKKRLKRFRGAVAIR
jgi:hypothetical protein